MYVFIEIQTYILIGRSKFPVDGEITMLNLDMAIPQIVQNERVNSLITYALHC